MNKKRITSKVLSGVVVVAVAAAFAMLPVVYSAEESMANPQTATAPKTTETQSMTAEPAKNAVKQEKMMKHGNNKKMSHKKMHPHSQMVKCVMRTCRGIKNCSTDRVNGQNIFWVKANSKAVCDQMRGTNRVMR